jgi:hypothetical protein
VFFRDVVDRIFGAKSRAEADRYVEEHNRWYMDIVGSSANGYLGKKAVNSSTAFNSLFSEEEYTVATARDDSGLNDKKLDKLEEQID